MDENLQLQKRLNELALRARYSGAPACTRFLEPTMERMARSAANQAEVGLALYGGYAQAERRIAAFHTGNAPETWEYPLSCLEIRWDSRYTSPGHRDLLGAAMGLGLERHAMGDIAMGAQEGCAYLFAHIDVEDYIVMNLESAGRARLRVRKMETPPEIRAPEGVCMRVTVSSPRLDAILAAGLKLSRSEAQRLIEGGMVKRNHAETLRGDLHLEDGDLLSVRGHGRMRVESLDGLTRKGRIAVRLFRYTG